MRGWVGVGNGGVEKVAGVSISYGFPGFVWKIHPRKL
jgi:hypothetical protein